MDIEKLKKVGKDIQIKKTHSNIQPKVLAILKTNTKNGEAVTQKEVAEILGKQLGREIRPQHARSVLLTLVKKDKAVRRVIYPPDENGNTVFFYSK